MVKIHFENDCVGCPQGCIHCGRDNTPYIDLYCDECGEAFDELRDVEGEQLCDACLLGRYNLISAEDLDAGDYV